MFTLVADNHPDHANIEGKQIARNLYLHGELESLVTFDLVHWVGRKPEKGGETKIKLMIKPLFYVECVAYLRDDLAGYVVFKGDIKAAGEAFAKMKNPTAML